MPHSDNQLARLQLSFSKNPNPTKEECEALGKGIDLTVQQVFFVNLGSKLVQVSQEKKFPVERWEPRF